MGAIENIMEDYNVDIEKRGTLNPIENCYGQGGGGEEGNKVGEHCHQSFLIGSMALAEYLIGCR